MKVVVWIREWGWEACVDAATLLPVQASIVLVHVAAGDVERLATGAHAGLLGRRPPREEPGLQSISEREAQSVLSRARERLGREAVLVARRGRIEHEVIDVARGADVLVLARDGSADAGPKSLGRAGRFIVDHAPCPVLLVPGTPGPPGPPPSLPSGAR